MEFVETLLPGVGVCYDATTRGGSPISLVIGRGGDAEMVTYRRDDPDAVAYRLHLEAHESVALAELLGASRLSTRLADLSREVPGLSSARFEILPTPATTGAGWATPRPARAPVARSSPSCVAIRCMPRPAPRAAACR